MCSERAELAQRVHPPTSAADVAMCTLCRADEVIVSTEEDIVQRVHAITGRRQLSSCLMPF